MSFCIIPKCVKVNTCESEAFNFSVKPKIIATEEGFKAKENLIKFLKDYGLYSENDNDSELSENVIVPEIILETDKNISKSECYFLSVKDNVINIIGKDEAGVFYGVQTLKQICLQTNFRLPQTEIEDYPRYSYRGFMLDVGRYFYSKEAVFQLLDIMAFHKLNVFHIHLSDDQGFRAQLEDKLLLTEIGSERSHTNFNSVPHSGYYTKNDLKEIVDYAHNRCIKVVPEIDSPGHTVSMIAAYPHLSCFDRKLVTATHWGVKHDVLCVGKESTYEFMFSLFDELLEIFTDGIVHLGGDEVPVTRWKICPHCQNKMKSEGLESEEDLHTYYLDRIAKHLRDKGVEVIMWNDKVKPYMVDNSVSWQLWNSAIEKAQVSDEIEKGREFVVSSSQAYYLDLPYALTDIEKCYNYNAEFSENDKGIKGLEACLWCEYVPTMKRALYLTLPRLGAFCESAWTFKENKSYEEFSENLPLYYSMLDSMGLYYANNKQIKPNWLTGLPGLLHWKKRPIHWHGLHNVLDNAYVKVKYSKKN